MGKAQNAVFRRFKAPILPPPILAICHIFRDLETAIMGADRVPPKPTKRVILLGYLNSTLGCVFCHFRNSEIHFFSTFEILFFFETVFSGLTGKCRPCV